MGTHLWSRGFFFCAIRDRNLFYDNIQTSQFMLSVVDSVLAGLVNHRFDFVLIKLWMKALCTKDAINKDLSFLRGAKEYFMDTPSIVDCFDLDGMVLSAFSWWEQSKWYLTTNQCVDDLWTVLVVFLIWFFRYVFYYLLKALEDGYFLYVKF